MNRHELRGELWEIQTALYAILTVLLFSLTTLKLLAGLMLIWTIISLIGTFRQLWKGITERNREGRDG